MHDCIVAAAGASSRMGAFKPLLDFRGSTIIQTVVGEAIAAGCRVLLVVGHRGDELDRLFEGSALVQVLRNAGWERGLLSSIQAALPAVRSSAFFVMLGDMPFVGREVYGLLARGTERGNPSPRARIASFEGRKGHPALIPSAWIPEILALPPQGMLRDYLATMPVELVDTGGDAALVDLDTPADYADRLGNPYAGPRH
ncbi:MAG: NTP transferase domain-containing protein [Spirochaetaceae bacterium]|nr:NTP transferase domain-containing protein [Spirochaetaceae bacterium]